MYVYFLLALFNVGYTVYYYIFYQPALFGLFLSSSIVYGVCVFALYHLVSNPETVSLAKVYFALASSILLCILKTISCVVNFAILSTGVQSIIQSIISVIIQLSTIYILYKLIAKVTSASTASNIDVEAYVVEKTPSAPLL
jgi:hypothetical protein